MIHAHPKNHALLVVRSSGGSGGRLLCFDFSQFEDRQGRSLRRGVAWAARFGDLLSDPDPEKSQRVMKALLTMKKLDVGALQQAFDHS
jgi:hypothetical protein